MVFDRFRKKKSQQELQDEIDELLEEESRLDIQIGHDKIRKRVIEKRRSQSTIGKIGRGLGGVADTVFRVPTPQTNKNTKKKNKKNTKTNKNTKKKDKKKDNYYFVPFI